jgi:hypothetical protein
MQLPHHITSHHREVLKVMTCRTAPRQENSHKTLVVKIFSDPSFSKDTSSLLQPIIEIRDVILRDFA